MMYIVDIKGEIEGDYTIIRKYKPLNQGKWIKSKDTYQWATYIYYDCPFCKTRFGKTSRYCPNCGARLIGDTDT